MYDKKINYQLSDTLYTTTAKLSWKIEFVYLTFPSTLKKEKKTIFIKHICDQEMLRPGKF